MNLSSVLLVLLSLLPVVDQDQPKVVGHEPMYVKVGDNVTLPCHLVPLFNVSNLTIEWRFQDRIIHLHRSGSKDDESSDPKFKGRTSLFKDEFKKGNISLKLTNVTKNDTGNYTCFVPKLPSQVKKGNVTLKVDENGAKGNLTDPGDGNGKNNNGRDIGVGVGVGIPVIVIIIIIIAIIIIAIIIAVLYYRRRKRNCNRPAGQWINNNTARYNAANQAITWGNQNGEGGHAEGNDPPVNPDVNPEQEPLNADNQLD